MKKAAPKKATAKKTTKPAADPDALFRKGVGERIKAIRTGKKLSAREFAEAIEMDPSQLVKIEAGIHSIRLEHLVRIADLYDRNIHYLATGNGPKYNMSAETVEKLRKKLEEMEGLLS